MFEQRTAMILRQLKALLRQLRKLLSQTIKWIKKYGIDILAGGGLVMALVHASGFVAAAIVAVQGGQVLLSLGFIALALTEVLAWTAIAIKAIWPDWHVRFVVWRNGDE